MTSTGSVVVFQKKERMTSFEPRPSGKTSYSVSCVIVIVKSCYINWSNKIKEHLCEVPTLKKKFHQYFSFSIYLSIPKRQLHVAWDYNQQCWIIGLYYSLQTNIHLNLITTNQPGFEPGSSGPKAAMLPLCYAPLTTLNKS